MPQNMIILLLGGNCIDFFPLRLKLGGITRKLHSHSHHAYKPKKKESLISDEAKANILHVGNDNKKIAVFTSRVDVS